MISSHCSTQIWRYELSSLYWHCTAPSSICFDLLPLQFTDSKIWTQFPCTDTTLLRLVYVLISSPYSTQIWRYELSFLVLTLHCSICICFDLLPLQYTNLKIWTKFPCTDTALLSLVYLWHTHILCSYVYLYKLYFVHEVKRTCFHSFIIVLINLSLKSLLRQISHMLIYCFEKYLHY